MKQIITVMIATILTTQTILATTDDWKHINLESYETHTNIDYQVHNQIIYDENAVPLAPAFKKSSKQTWVNVQRENLRSDDKVQVILLAFETVCNFSDCSPKKFTGVTKVIDLYFAENGRFTSQIEDLLINMQKKEENFGTTTINRSYELAVNINDVWYKDPRTDTNFQFSL